MAIPRSEWNARPARPLMQDGAKSTVVIHHSAGRALLIDTKREQIAAMQAIQRQHMDVNGWSDIGYAFVLFQPYGLLRRARLFEGRSVNAVPAAQLGANTGTIPICIVGDFRFEELKRVSRRRLVHAIKSLHAHHKVYKIRGHRDYGGTECPGDRLYKWLPTLRSETGLG